MCVLYLYMLFICYIYILYIWYLYVIFLYVLYSHLKCRVSKISHEIRFFEFVSSSQDESIASKLVSEFLGAAM